MAKDKKNSSDIPTPKKAAKKGPAKKAAAKQTVVEQAMAVAAVAESQILDGQAQKTQLSATELREEIRRRAYELYRQRGGVHGLHEADWHRAEAEVRARFNR